MDRREKIIEVFRKADKQSVYLECAEATGWMIADAQKQGLTKEDAIQMAKQQYLVMSEVFADWANNFLERSCEGLKPYIRDAKK